MSNIKVLPETIKIFYDHLVEGNKNLLDIVSKIEEVTIGYQEMMISRSSTLFQEFMISEQENMKQKIMENEKNISDKILFSFNEYSSAIDEIKGRVV